MISGATYVGVPQTVCRGSLTTFMCKKYAFFNYNYFFKKSSHNAPGMKNVSATYHGEAKVRQFDNVVAFRIDANKEVLGLEVAVHNVAIV
jgi:hypothetical protein